MYQLNTQEKSVDKSENSALSTRVNKTGIPSNIKSRFEAISNYSFDDVRVHYNSPEPAKLQALAYTQGTQIYIAPGQAAHLGHELGHVVQQKQGRVHPTRSLYTGVPLNDDSAMEAQADAIARTSASLVSFKDKPLAQRALSAPILQRRLKLRNGHEYDASNRERWPWEAKDKPRLTAKANDAGLHLLNRKFDFFIKDDDEILSPHRHLIGEEHDQSHFEDALENWGWGAEKIFESYQTSTEVSDIITVSNQAIEGIYHGMGELDNLHAYIIHGLAMLKYTALDVHINSATMSVFAADAKAGNVARKQSFEMNIDAYNRGRKRVLEQWNSSVLDHIGSYEAACEAYSSNPPNVPDVLMDNFVADMPTIKTNCENSINILRDNPDLNFKLVRNDPWQTVHDNLNRQHAAANLLINNIDNWTNHLMNFIRRQYIVGLNAVAAGAGLAQLDNAYANLYTGDVDNLHVNASVIREPFMIKNINAKPVPLIVGIGRYHVNSISGTGGIHEGKYHNDYNAFVADTKN